LVAVAAAVVSGLIGYVLSEKYFGAGFLGAMLSTVVVAVVLEIVNASGSSILDSARRLTRVGADESELFPSEGRTQRLALLAGVALATAGVAALVTHLMVNAPGGGDALWMPVFVAVVLVIVTLTVSAIISIYGGAKKLGVCALTVLGIEVVVALALGFTLGLRAQPSAISVPAVFAAAFVVLQATNPYPWLALGWMRKRFLGAPHRSFTECVNAVGRLAVAGSVLIPFTVMTVGGILGGVDWALGQGVNADTWQRVVGAVLGAAGGAALGFLLSLFVFLYGLVIYPVAALLSAWAAWAWTYDFGD
jgi:hypothetical protein